MSTIEPVEAGPRRSNISARTRLEQMAPVFTLNQMATLTDMTVDQAAIYAHRWARKGLIGLAGPKAGIYYNLVRNPRGAAEHRHLALLQAHPTAVVRGESVLHAAGWTTQVPQTTTVAALRNTPAIEGFTIVTRSREWLAGIRAWYASDPVYGLPALTPAIALAELHATREHSVWRPQVDDLEEATVLEAAPDIIMAFAAFEIELPPSFRALLAETEDDPAARKTSRTLRP